MLNFSDLTGSRWSVFQDNFLADLAEAKSANSCAQAFCAADPASFECNAKLLCHDLVLTSDPLLSPLEQNEAASNRRESREPRCARYVYQRTL